MSEKQPNRRRWRPPPGDVACKPFKPKPPDLVPSTVDKSGRPADLSGAVDYVEIWRVDFEPRWRGGVIQVAGTIADDPAGVGVTYQYAAIEYRILGYVGPTARVLRRGALGGAATTALYQVEDPSRYSVLAVEARKIIDGATGSAITPLQIVASVLARFSRG